MRKTRSRRKSQSLGKRRSAPGAAPGVIVVDPSAESTDIRVMAFGAGEVHEQSLTRFEDFVPLRKSYRTIWVDVTGLGSEEKLRKLSELLHLHPLAMEDVVNVHQRSKVDDFVDHLFVVARMIDNADSFQTEQLSFFLLPGVLISFQERPGDCWEPLRQRIRTRRGKVCESGPDHLLYALLDAVIDSYFPAMEKISDAVDLVEIEITEQIEPSQLMKIHDLRGQLLALRRSLRPHREMINELVRDSLPIIQPETRVHLRDCYDHVVQLIDSVDTYRELTSDLRDYYMSTVSNSMNEIMKVLTIISTIFIPLSFVAGVYGMNFSDHSPWNMPELKWYFGYPFALSIMFAMAIGLLIYFRKRNWF
jgi:magnesium transporter